MYQSSHRIMIIQNIYHTLGIPSGSEFIGNKLTKKLTNKHTDTQLYVLIQMLVLNLTLAWGLVHQLKLQMYLFIYFYFIYLYMKPTHKTVYTNIERYNMCCWLIGNCRDKPLTQRRKSYNRAKAKHSIKSRPKHNRQQKLNGKCL